MAMNDVLPADPDGDRLDGVPASAWDRQDVPALLRLDEVAPDLFRSRHNQRNVNAALYGGQVAAQALAAASRTVSGRPVHSLHAYFLRPGSVDTRVLFRVERVRDGRNFSTRRVSAVQNGKTLLEMLCSFAERQHGFVHQAPMPDVPPPESLQTLTEIARADTAGLPAYIRSFETPGPIEVKPLTREELTGPTGRSERDYWLRVPGASGITDPADGAALITYISDFWLPAAALTRHTHPSPDEKLFVASIDHAVWFHRPLAAPDGWMLYHTDSPSAKGGINMARGLIFDRHGTLIASTAQEALQLPR
jgi:acyl-CoA thioesterase-2